MAPFLARRTLGPITSEMGGDPAPPVAPSYMSVTQTNDITSIGSDAGTGNARILFNTSEQGTTPVLTTNDESVDITFAADGGTFTAAKSGTYYITVTFVAEISAISQFDVRIKVGSTVKHTRRSTVHTSADPVEVTSAVVLGLDAGDIVTVVYEDDGSANVFPNLGSTVNMVRVGSVGSGGGGVGGGGVTIQNNVAGYILKATGDDGIIEGMPQFVSSSTGLTASVDVYISGSGPLSAVPNLFIQGTDSDGNISKMKIMVKDGFLKMVDDDIE